MTAMRFSVVSLISLVLLGLLACGRQAGNSELPVQPDPPSAGLPETQPPPGVEPQLWKQLSSEFTRVLTLLGTDRSTATAPVDDASRVPDLQVTASGSNGALFTFSYRNTGDYDQNGEVNISDLTPVGVHFHARHGDDNWTEAEVADGDANGEVNLADITPIAVCYRHRLDGYMLQRSSQSEGSDWQDIAAIPQASAQPTAQHGHLRFSHELADSGPDAWYRVVPYLNPPEMREYGIASNEVFFGPGALAAPIGLVASEGLFEDHIELNWTAVAAASAYELYRDQQSTPFVQLGNVTQYLDYSPADSNPHQYWIRATDGVRLSNFSDSAIGWLATAAVTLDPPSAVQASDGSFSDHVMISWNKSPGADAYEIYRDSQAALLATTGDAAYYNDYGLADELPHTYWVVASSGELRSQFSLSDTGYRGKQPTGSMVVLGYNDLGMHCMNEDFSEFMILPPFNTLHATVVDRSQGEPRLVSSGVTLQYSIIGNTYSAGKTNFWDYAEPLLGASPAPNIGLTGNGLAGTMQYSGGTNPDWVVTGIPLTPINDAGEEDAYPLASITVLRNGVETAHTLAVTPVSWEISCEICHNTPGISVATDILRRHDNLHGTDLENSKPVTCGLCHAQPELGLAGVSGLPTLSSAMHSAHSSRMGGMQLTTECYACHPGNRTQCLRDVHFSNGLSCQSCHGSMADVGNPARQPWVDEPRCDSCHSRPGFDFEQPGTLYRDSIGHHGIHCSACHGSPHAITPTVVSNDNLQAIGVQGYPGVINKCSVCHDEVPDKFEHFVGEVGDN